MATAKITEKLVHCFHFSAKHKIFTKLPLGYDILHCHKDFVQNFMKIFFDGFYESFQFLKAYTQNIKLLLHVGIPAGSLIV